MTNNELIAKAESVLHPHTSKENKLFGDVGAAIETEEGNIYTGVSVDTASWGLCAERSAIATMITNKEYKIKKVAAVWKDERDGKLYVLPPCGVCREFMRRVDEANLDTEVILDRNESLKLRELLPKYEWPNSLD